jgi:phosphoglycolate phosphatase-like HAD superfamily hydrolase
MLLLFDIDGTLVRDRPLTHQSALEQAAIEVVGLAVDPGSDPIRAVEPWGKTDRQILRDVLAAAGLPAPSREDVARWEQAACRAYEQLESDDAAARHAETALALGRLRDSGHALALVTGNLEPIARRKLGLRGLARFFPEGQGGFGSDADLRPELVPIARTRAGAPAAAHPREDTVLIGDTPRDVEAARADGVRCVAVTGERFSAGALIDAGANATVESIPEVETALAAL